MKQGFRKRIIILVCGFTIGLIGVISWLNYWWYLDQVVEQTAGQMQQLMEQLGANTDNYIDELYRLTLSPYYNDEIMNELEVTRTGKEERLVQKRKMENFFSSVMTLPRREILRVYIMTEQEIYSYTRTPYEMQDYNNYKEADWYIEALKSSKPVFIPIHEEKAFGDNKTTIISIARRIRSKKDNNKVLGVVKVDADHSAIQSMCDKIDFEHRGALFMITDKGDNIYKRSTLDDEIELEALKEAIDSGSRVKDESFTRRFVPVPQSLQTLERYGYYYESLEGVKYICSSVCLKESGIRIIALNSYEDIRNTALKGIGRTLFLVLLSLIAALVILLIIMKQFFRPLYAVVSAMKKMEEGDLSVQVTSDREDEVGYLADAFNRMTGNLQQVMKRNTELAAEVYETKFRQKASQYEALCSQIKPHFIHNTLNTISLLVKCGEYQKAIKCIEDLSLFLRSVMHVDNDVSIERELELVKAYLSICQNRYGERLEYTIEIKDNLYRQNIPAFTIQPIVENAIKHSCEQTRKKIKIEVLAVKTAQDYYHIVVCDDGVGIPKEKLEELQKSLKDDEQIEQEAKEDIRNSSIGLVNVKRRIQLKFGEKSYLKVRSEGKGTVVELGIPL